MDCQEIGGSGGESDIHFPFLQLEQCPHSEKGRTEWNNPIALVTMGISGGGG